MKLVNTSYRCDGTLLQKVERYSPQGVERFFLINGYKVSLLIKRLNIFLKSDGWLALSPDASNYYQIQNKVDFYFGEIGKNNKSNGRGISISADSCLHIYCGYYQEGYRGPGNFMLIARNGVF